MWFKRSFFYVFPIVCLLGANDPQGETIFDPGDMIGRIYVGHYVINIVMY